ncbi:hypothetical protein LEP1GSC058_1386 [Leptospira fainei serovar Hurstbridge str. BUT 6]|uniref:Uncharacterized protein n=1 Tax=Leptospira fainei serovar Hurstbridge str. BUT 6 TaxID=1193011 RepID=S3VIK3_9LEPT|nr:hypothetical protein LEP1GSC058_1386 [Leptospira fainei serovar Hurstbridge str. BUT 6]
MSYRSTSTQIDFKMMRSIIVFIGIRFPELMKRQFSSEEFIVQKCAASRG